MKNGGIAIFKKEMARFFGDKRLVFSTLILPALMIFIIYTVMGFALDSFVSVDDDYKYSVAVINMPEEIRRIFSSDEYKITDKDISQLDDCKNQIGDKKLDLCVVFPDDFMDTVNSFKENKTVSETPNVEMYYNSTSVPSSNAYDIIAAALNAYEKNMANVFDVNKIGENDDTGKYDMATDAETTGTLMATIFPLILMTFLFSSCTSLAPESIAGEKERGTMATLLITPVARNQIAIGKICALAIIALLSGISSFLGTLLSLPSLFLSMSGSSDDTASQSADSSGSVMAGVASAEFYKTSDWIWMVLVIITTALLFVTVISIISAYAKTIKEAQTFVSPLMIVVMVISLSSMYSTEAKTGIASYFIPVYNSVQSFVGLFSFTATTANLAVTVLSNLAYSLVGVFVLTKMFKSERIMF